MVAVRARHPARAFGETEEDELLDDEPDDGGLCFTT